MDGRGNLGNLRDIVVPEPPPLWPPAPELWLLITAALLLAGIVFFQWHRRRRQNAYRRAGLYLLHDAGTLHDVSVILKRVALVSFPREQVASLYGEDWAAFLSQTCPNLDFSALAQTSAEEAVDSEMRRLAAQWIRHHRSPRRAGGF